MQQLKEISQMKMEELKVSLSESQFREQQAMFKERVCPNEYGNRKERRAAKALARRSENA